MTSTRSEVVVIGGGVAGISAALELSKTHDVIIIEKKHLFYGSSGRNPGRMGHGFHYIDYETAKLYLEASIQVQRTYPHFLIGEHLPFSHPVRHGRYFVTKTSLYSFTEVLETYQKLQQRYAELVAEDPENKVFGEPESFFRILAPSEYQDHINAEIIEGAVETCEHLFNWQAFSHHIRDIIGANSRISLYENSEVVDLAHYEEFGARFKVTVKTRRGLHEFKTNYIVNSAWENIEQLNDKLGITYINGQRTNRLKCLVEVKLPSSLLAVNSSFFCMGSFCMFSNMGDGRAMMTLADVTNMEVSSAKSISAEMARYVNGDISREEKRRIGEEIKAGVAAYIPQMINADVLDVKFGIVQTKGELSLKDLNHREGAHHVRNYHHIREEMQGLIANPAMKLFYFVQNGIRVREIFDTQLARDLVISEILHTIQRVCSSNRLLESAYFEKEIFRAMAIQIDKMSHVYPELVVQLTTLMEQKKQLNRELLKLDLSHKFIFNFGGLKQKSKPLVEPENFADAAATSDGYLKHLFLSVSHQERSPNASGRRKTATFTSRQEHSSFTAVPAVSLQQENRQCTETKIQSTDTPPKSLLIHELPLSSSAGIPSMSPSSFPVQFIDASSTNGERLSQLLLSTAAQQRSPNSRERGATNPSPRGLSTLKADFLDLMKRSSVSPGLPFFDRDLETNCKKPKPVKETYSHGTYLFSPSTISRAKSDQAIALGSR